MALNIKKIRPMFNQVITTMDKYSDDEMKTGSIIDVSKVNNPIKEYQKVVAVGPMVRNIEVGDIVMINPKRYGKVRHKEGSLKDGVITDNPVVSYNFNVIELNHTPFLLLLDQDIDFIIEEYEEVKDSPQSDIIVPNNDIIV